MKQRRMPTERSRVIENATAFILIIAGASIVALTLAFGYVWWSFLSTTTRTIVQVWAIVATALIFVSLMTGVAIGRKLTEEKFWSRVEGWDEAMQRSTRATIQAGQDMSRVRARAAKQQGARDLPAMDLPTPWMGASGASETANEIVVEA
jgi:hypothetical protein